MERLYWEEDYISSKTLTIKLGRREILFNNKVGAERNFI